MEMLGQPNDDFHQFMHKLRKAYKRVYVRQNSNVLLRESLNMREFDKHGVTAAKLPLDAALLADMYSWRSLPEEVVRSLRSNRQTYRQTYRQTAKAALTNFDKDRSSKRDGPFVHTYAYIYVYIYIYTHPKCIMCSTASSLILSFAAGWLGNDNNGRCRATPSQAKNHEAQRKTHKNINKQAKWKVLRMLAQPRSTCNNGVGFSIAQAENEYRSCQTMLQMQIPSSCPGPSQGCQKKDCLSLAEKLRFYIITCVLGWLFLETRVVLEIPSQITLVRKARLV